MRCSEIADMAGKKVWITARPAAVALCEMTGFKEVAGLEVDLNKYGGKGVEVTKCMVGEPSAIPTQQKLLNPNTTDLTPISTYSILRIVWINTFLLIW